MKKKMSSGGVQAISYGTAGIVSLKEKGSAFTVDIPAKVEVKIVEKREKKKNISGKISPELKKLAGETLKFFGFEENLEIKVREKIPEGLGGKEALSLALVFAVSGALARKYGSINELKIDKYLKEQFLIINGIVVDKEKLLDICSKKLKFEKLAASFYGGFVVTDNEKRKILRRGEMEDFFLLLKKLKNRKMKQIKFFENELERAWNEALKGNLYQAMKLNALICENEETKKMLGSGALTVSLSYPYLLGLFRKKNKIQKARLQKTINSPAGILEKPKKIFKINDFLKLKGAEGIEGVGF